MKLRILKLGLYLLAVPWATALIVVILLLRPFIEVRLFVIPLRMTVITAAEWIRVLREKSRKPLIVLANDEDQRIVNQSLAHHLGTYAGWRRGPRALLIVARVIAERAGLLEQVEIRAPSAPFDDVFWHRTYDYRPSLSPAEQELAEQGLNALGITESTRPIAILTRDRAFFKSLTNDLGRRHDYRNCRIENYSRAIEYAYQQGFRSVRVGRVSDNHLEVEPDGYVDYSASPVQSDLMDLVLATRCEFIVTCSSGIDALYWLCGKSFIGVNLPWLDGKFANYSLALPKRMLVEIDGALTELPVIAVTSSAFVPQSSSNRYRVPHWKGNPVAFQENSAAEILETIQLALAMQADPRLAEERRKLVAPLWAEFNRRVASSNLGADSRVRVPAMPMPDSVIARFLEVPIEQRR
jgi:putative glycosyltransferase (TIGR04372 family)